MAINKIQFGGQTLIDLTGDTVTAADLASGVTAHDRTGTQITGTSSGGGAAVFRDFLFEDTITTASVGNYAEASYSPTSSNWLAWQPTAMDLVVNNVAYDNVVMQNDPNGRPCFGAPYDSNSVTYDFSTYPFCLQFDYWNNWYYLITQTAGTYHVVATQVKTITSALVTITNNTGSDGQISTNDEYKANIQAGTTQTVSWILENGSQYYELWFDISDLTVTGGVTFDANEGYGFITGPGTITVS